jgi:hypothetical protein
VDALDYLCNKHTWLQFDSFLRSASEGQYGESGIEVFQMEAAKRNICIAVQEKEHNPQIATNLER